MSNFTEAADAIRRIARLTEGFQLAAKALDEIGSLSNATKEAKEAASAAVLARDAALLDLSKSVSDVSVQKDKAKALAADATEKALGILAQAQAQAQAVIDEATSLAVSRVAVIEGNANRIYAQIKADTETVIAERSGVKAQLAAVVAEVAAKVKQLDDLNKSLDALKAKLG
jgi:predicted  nucleic acid-binding Zn-ribbon protein